MLSLLFKAILGIKRVFHFETISDVGFALLTGGRRVLSRERLGSLIRKVDTKEVLRLVRKTEPEVQHAPAHHLSIDEHSIARFTRKFNIRKGFHTIRNKKMKIEKVAYSFLADSRRVLSLVVARGDRTLNAIAASLLRRLRPKARGAQVRVTLDAAAAQNHADLFKLVDAHKEDVFLVRVPRRPTYRKLWTELPAQAFVEHQEPGPYKAAPAKVMHVADIKMLVKSKSGESRQVRTIVSREKTKRGKDRWHALWIFGDEQMDAYQLVSEFRQRQHHEQRHRILVHDAYVDTAPSGYDKQSNNPARPRFLPNALTLYGWITGLATNLLQDWSLSLPASFHRAHPRTLCRWLLATPAELYQSQDALTVVVRPHRLRPLWQRLIAEANRDPVRLPWLDQRRVLFSLGAPYRISLGTSN